MMQTQDILRSAVQLRYMLEERYSTIDASEMPIHGRVPEQFPYRSRSPTPSGSSSRSPR